MQNEFTVNHFRCLYCSTPYRVIAKFETFQNDLQWVVQYMSWYLLLPSWYTYLSLSLFVSESKSKPIPRNSKNCIHIWDFLCFHHQIASTNNFRLIGLLANVNFDTNLRENSSKNGTGVVSPLAISYFQKVDQIWPKKQVTKKSKSASLYR